MQDHLNQNHENAGDLVDGLIKARNHKLTPTCICLDSISEHAYTGSKDGSIIKWSLSTQKILSKINPVKKSVYHSNKTIQQRYHTGHINSLAISSDDKLLASGGHDKNIRIWSAKDLSWLHTFSLHRHEVTALVFRQGTNTLYSGSADRAVNLWSLEDDENRCYVESLYGHESPITSLDCLKKERVISSGGRDQSLRLWKIVEQAQTVLETNHQSVDVVKFVDNQTFVSGGEDGSITIWSTSSRKPLCSVQMAHEPNLSGKDDDSVPKKCWISAIATYPMKEDPVKNPPTKKRKVDNDDNPLNGGHEDDEESEDEHVTSENTTGGICMIASGSCNSAIKIWKLIKSSNKYKMELHRTIDCPGFINDIKFTHDGDKIVVACGQEHKFGRWWKIRTAKNGMRILSLN